MAGYQAGWVAGLFGAGIWSASGTISLHSAFRILNVEFITLIFTLLLQHDVGRIGDEVRSYERLINAFDLGNVFG